MRFRIFLLIIVACTLSATAGADVVKPALVEISANTNGSVRIEVRASIEALLTGINARYKNTQDAPTAEEYDALRVLQSGQLHTEFEPFKQEFLGQIYLKADDVIVPLDIVDVWIPEPGYTKVPRISVITLAGELDQRSRTLQWYYPAQFGDNAVRVRQVDEDNQQWHWSEWQWLRKDEPSQSFSLEELFTRRPVSEVVWSYMVIGFEHIVPRGIDHILFIIGIFLLSTRMRPLLWQVTMFTVAHTLTLALSMKGIISLPSSIVEPLIALSIAYVGIENIFAKSLHKSRLVLVFLFGLLHGLGFADVLAEFGMPPNAFATALISFNIGVELGQIAVIVAAYLLIGIWFRKKPWYHQRITVPCSAIISVIGLYWTYDRIMF
ncbi:MAG: HupE/UreJ family protein [Thiotrichales bacterium]|nr:MAG: HupE/UreJ family protein [Thiotrichales bacterium]